MVDVRRGINDYLINAHDLAKEMIKEKIVPDIIFT